MADAGQLPAAASAIDQDIFCQDCGYNLRTLTGDRCPECGRSLEGLRSSVSQIPWVHRKEIGRFRAYWKTVWFVMFRQRQFCDEMVRPVSYSDSQVFRWVTVGIVGSACIAALCVRFATYGPRSWDNEIIQYLFTHKLILLAAIAGILICLAGLTGIPSYFFHPRRISISQQNRAIALSYYACGAFSILFIPILMTIPAMLLPRRQEVWGVLFGILAIGFSPAPFIIWWLDLIHLSRRLLPTRPFRALGVAVFVPCFQIIFALLIIMIPALIFAIGLVLYCFF